MPRPASHPSPRPRPACGSYVFFDWKDDAVEITHGCEVQLRQALLSKEPGAPDKVAATPRKTSTALKGALSLKGGSAVSTAAVDMSGPSPSLEAIAASAGSPSRALSGSSSAEASLQRALTVLLRVHSQVSQRPFVALRPCASTPPAVPPGRDLLAAGFLPPRPHFDRIAMPRTATLPTPRSRHGQDASVLAMAVPEWKADAGSSRQKLLAEIERLGGQIDNLSEDIYA